jgi:hypothetical protein
MKNDWIKTRNVAMKKWNTQKLNGIGLSDTYLHNIQMKSTNKR